MGPPLPIYYKVLIWFQNIFWLKIQNRFKIHFNPSMNDFKILLIPTFLRAVNHGIMVLKWTKKKKKSPAEFILTDISRKIPNQ